MAAIRHHPVAMWPPELDKMAAIKPHRKDLYLKKIGDFSFIYSFCDQLMYWIFLDMQSVTTGLAHQNTLGEKISYGIK